MERKTTLKSELTAGSALVKALKAAALLLVFASLVLLVSAFTAAGSGSVKRDCLVYAGFSLAAGLLTMGLAEAIRWLQKVWQSQQRLSDLLEGSGPQDRHPRSAA